MELIMKRNVDTKPNNIRIKKGEKAQYVMDMENGYVMICYKGCYYPVPKDSIEIKKDNEI